MAIYAADIRIGVVNKNVLINLNKLLNTSLSISKRLNRELTKLGKVNKIRIDNKQALASLDAIQQRINKINSTPIAPRTRGRGGGRGSEGFSFRGSAMRSLTASSALIPGVSPLAVGAGAGALSGGGLKGAATGLGVAALVQVAVATANFARQSAIAGAEVKKMKVALQGVTPDYDSYATALNNVRTLSDKYAISQVDTIKNFTKLQASASASGFSVEDVTKAYEGLTAGTIATGGNQEKLNGIMLAASQVFAKGKVAAEEIRGQVSERLPGAMAVFADSMGISGKALDKLLQEGKVTMEDFLNFTKHLGKIHKETADKMVKDSSNAGQRLSKEWNDLMINMGAITQPVGAALQTMLAGVLGQINNVSEKLIRLMGLTKEAQIESIQQKIIDTQRKIFELEEKKILRDSGVKLNRVRGGDLVGNFEYESRETRRGSDILGSTGILGPMPLRSGATRTIDNVEAEKKNRLQDTLNKLKERFNELTGKSNELSNTQSNADIEAGKQRELIWKQIEDRLKLDIQYQKDLNTQGQKYADTQRMINELLQQFPDKSDEVRELVYALQEAEEQGKSAAASLNEWSEELDKRLKELQDPIRKLKTLVEAASDSFQSDFKEIIRGTKSVGDAFVNMFNRIADSYLDMVAEMLASQAKQGMLSFIGGIFGRTGSPGISAPGMRAPTQISGRAAAAGAYVDRPTNILTGEAGPEYILREDQMAGALARYASGQRGQSVIPGTSYSSGGGSGGGDVVVSYTGPTLNFNGDEYVPKSSVPDIIKAAAKRGAREGQAKALGSLKNSRSTRSRVGL